MRRIMISRMVTSLLYGIVISFVTTMCVNLIITDGSTYPVIPDFASRFPSPAAAYLVQILLMGVISATFGGASIIYEKAEWGYLKQGVIYFLVTSCVWFPIAVTCLGLFQNIYTFLPSALTFTLTYIVVWIIQYISCRKKIDEINDQLKKSQ